MTPAFNSLYGNFIINGGGGMFPIDHDDGSQRYRDTHNVLLYGGAKYFMGNEKIADSNLYVFPDIVQGGSCIYNQGPQWPEAGYGEKYTNNHCLLYNASHIGGHDSTTSAANTFGASCDIGRLNLTVTHTANNTYMATDGFPAGGPAIMCGAKVIKFSAWQALGQEAGSVARLLPAPALVVAMARQVLAAAPFAACQLH
jgi:hypothetical protein